MFISNPVVGCQLSVVRFGPDLQLHRFGYLLRQPSFMSPSSSF